MQKVEFQPFTVVLTADAFQLFIKLNAGRIDLASKRHGGNPTPFSAVKIAPWDRGGGTFAQTESGKPVTRDERDGYEGHRAASAVVGLE